METRQKSRRKARQGERGAALVEAAVTIPFFITIFVALMFVGSLYTEKQRTVTLSRQQAWVYAMKNCSGQMAGVSSEDGGSIPQQGDQNFGDTQQFNSAPGGNTASKGTKLAISTVKGSASAKSSQISFEQKMQTTTWVTCNEEPVNGDIKGVLKFAWGLFTGW
jgi:Flp pilus assembly protein TadG